MNKYCLAYSFKPSPPPLDEKDFSEKFIGKDNLRLPHDISGESKLFLFIFHFVHANQCKKVFVEINISSN
jgi:hypothetical protein